jgi:hypothetical protein
MQTIGQSSGTIKRYKQAGYHRQSGRKPCSDFRGSENSDKRPDKDVIERGLSVNAIGKRLPDSRNIGQPSYIHGDNLVNPKQTMRRNVQACGDVKGSEDGRGGEAPDVREAYPVFYLM